MATKKVKKKSQKEAISAMMRMAEAAGLNAQNLVHAAWLAGYNAGVDDMLRPMPTAKKTSRK